MQFSQYFIYKGVDFFTPKLSTGPGENFEPPLTPGRAVFLGDI